MIGLCRLFGCLPWPGSLMEQPAELLRMLDVYQLGHRDEEGGDVAGE